MHVHVALQAAFSFGDSEARPTRPKRKRVDFAKVNKSFCDKSHKIRLRRQLRTLARQYKEDTAAVEAFAQASPRCPMTYVQVNEQSFEERPLAVVAQVRRTLGLARLPDETVAEWISAPYHGAVCNDDALLRKNTKAIRRGHTRGQTRTYKHGVELCKGLLEWVAKVFKHPYVFDQPWGVARP